VKVKCQLMDNLVATFDANFLLQDTGTIKALQNKFDPEADAKQIRNTLKSASVNETVLINILPHRTNAQRQKIRLTYKTMYGKVSKCIDFNQISPYPYDKISKEPGIFTSMEGN